MEGAYLQGSEMPQSGVKHPAVCNKGRALDWYQSIFELIDMRSFSNLWYWIALAVMWSTASHWVLGVPWDMVIRAPASRRTISG